MADPYAAAIRLTAVNGVSPVLKKALSRSSVLLVNNPGRSMRVCCTDVPNFPWRAEGDRRQAISARSFIVPFKDHSKGRRHIVVRSRRLQMERTL